MRFLSQGFIQTPDPEPLFVIASKPQATETSQHLLNVLEELIPEYSRIAGLPIQWSVSQSCKMLGCRPDFCAFFQAEKPKTVHTKVMEETGFKYCEYKKQTGEICASYRIPVTGKTAVTLQVDPVPEGVDVGDLQDKFNFIGKWIYRQYEQQRAIERKL